jgi:opacity protein-like surface antigen
MTAHPHRAPETGGRHSSTMFHYRLAFACLLLAACSAPSTALRRDSAFGEPSIHLDDSLANSAMHAQQPPNMPPGAMPSSQMAPRWNVGQTMMQGYFGSTEFTKAEVDSGGGITIDGDKGDLDQLPVFGGGGQYKLGGERIDLGLETLFSFAWRANATAFAIGGGGAAVAVDTDLLLIELYGGPYASMFLGNNLRAYGGIGPLFQFANYSQDNNVFDDGGSGFGFGYYTRAGLEFRLPSHMWIGVGARWSDSQVDLSGNSGDLNLEGFQFLITFSQGV